jgi:carbamoyl-phosphate synthase small subunit
MTEGYLVLDDGTTYEGQLFGADIESAGKLVFVTGGVDGYQELLTDPNTKGKMLVLTYPLVGNYGVTDAFNESDRIYASGIVIRELCTEPSPFYNGTPLADFMAQKGAVGITGVDTRELTLKIREKKGLIKAKIVKAGTDVNKVVEELKTYVPDTSIADSISKDVKKIDNGKDVTVAVIDCGTGCSLYEVLGERCNVIRFPYDAKAEDILKSGAKGVIVSSGPACPDSDGMKVTVETIKAIHDKIPVMGISLGCELIAVALGAETDHIRPGHFGFNQPVKINGRICMTTQLRDHSIKADTLEKAGFIITQTNLNDGVVEGFKHSKLPIYGYEYHPEAGNGFGDTVFLFDDFLQVIKGVSQ